MRTFEYLVDGVKVGEGSLTYVQGQIAILHGVSVVDEYRHLGHYTRMREWFKNQIQSEEYRCEFLVNCIVNNNDKAMEWHRTTLALQGTYQDLHAEWLST